MDAMRVVDQQLREFAAGARQREAARQVQAEEQNAASSPPTDQEPPVITAMTDALPGLEPVGDGPARALVAGSTAAAAAGPALSGAVGEGVLGRAAAGLLGAMGAPAALLGGVLWPSPTGDSTLSGTGLTLADAPGFEPRILPDGVDTGVGIDPDAGKPMVLATPAAAQAGPDIEVFDPPSVDPATVFEQSKLRRNMEAKGRITEGQVAHHIVPGGRPMNGGRDATQSQKLLEGFKIDRDGVDNGAALSPQFHGKIHTKEYYDYAQDQIERATSKEDAEERLKNIGSQLQEADRVYQQNGQLPKWSN